MKTSTINNIKLLALFVSCFLFLTIVTGIVRVISGQPFLYINGTIFVIRMVFATALTFYANYRFKIIQKNDE